MLGLASLYRYGWNAQAMEFKISSLRALAKASETYDLVNGSPHVAAGMLLCSLEVWWTYQKRLIQSYVAFLT